MCLTSLQGGRSGSLGIPPLLLVMGGHLRHGKEKPLPVQDHTQMGGRSWMENPAGFGRHLWSTCHGPAPGIPGGDPCTCDLPDASPPTFPIVGSIPGPQPTRPPASEYQRPPGHLISGHWASPSCQLPHLLVSAPRSPLPRALP